MFKIGVHYAFRNIIRTPLRSFFTIFSIAMIISMYTLLTAVANSFTGQLSTLIKQENVDIIVQSKFSATPISSTISHKLVTELTSDPLVGSQVAVVLGKKRFEDRSIAYLFGISNFLQISGKLGLTLDDGRLYDSGKREIIIAKRLMKTKKLQIGDTLSLSEEAPFKIVGTYHSWISFFNSSIICDLENARSVLGKPGKTNMLFLSLKDPRKTKDLIEKINKRHDSLLAVKSSDFSSTLGAVKNMFYLSDIIAVITLIIASAILINTFLMAVNERTKEIGILNAIGWPRGMIVYIFIVESLFLALIGGIFGFLISFGMLIYIKAAFANISFYLPDSLDLGIFGYTMLMSVLVGIFSAIFPALYATKIMIAKALRDA